MQRLSWLIGSQSFLFTAYAIALNGLMVMPATTVNALISQEKLLLQLIPVVAIVTGGLIFVSILAAVRSIRGLRESYHSRFGQDDPRLPGIMGKSSIRRFGFAAPVLVPPVFILIWLMLWMRGIV